MREILDYAERRTRARLEELRDGEWEARDVLEGGADGSEDIELRVKATIAGDELELDFTGSADQVDGNLNCPLSVTRSAAFFCVRVLLDPDAPPSAGAHRPVEVSAPEGSVLNARRGRRGRGRKRRDLEPGRRPRLRRARRGRRRPGAGPGDDEQPDARRHRRLRVDLLRDARRRAGRVPRTPTGPSAIHVAMSNTLNTPIEALETELPLRVRELSVRRGSGGDGAHRGGDGIVRELEALEPMSYSLITERRRHAPQGRAGGGDGAAGREPR